MDKHYIKNSIEALKSSSSSRVQETLLKIRSKIIVDDKGIKLFRECNGFDHLIPHLRKPNERILDLTLSILGNCCLEEQSSIAVGKLNVFGPLISVLKTVCRDSIVGRACRVIGNLAQKSDNAESLHNHGAVTALVSLIENRDKNTSYPTLTMAIRAIRQLWMVTEKREEMLSLNSVRCIAILLTAECETAGIIKCTNVSNDDPSDKTIRKSQEELISGILKCLGYFTTYSTAQCAEQIQGDGRGFQCLVALTKTFEPLALKCLVNLCYLSPCRPMLGMAGFVECLVGILQKATDLTWWPKGAARALSQLSGESVNRSRLRHCGGLPLLVTAAKVDMHALQALLQYLFDDTSFQILVNEGLINLLTEDLINHLTTMDYEHNYTDLSFKNKDITDTSICEEDTSTNTHNSCLETTNNSERKESLFVRRKGPLSNGDDDELKVVIERDNMLVGFIDAVDSDASDDSNNDENLSSRRRCLKRARSISPNTVKKKNQVKNKDWSAGVYWEPKSPEWPSTSSPSLRSPDHVPLSPYSDGNQSGFSPEYKYSSKRGKWDWSPESGVGSGCSSSPYWTEYQWSPSSSTSPTSPLSVNEDSSDSEMSGRYSPVCSEHEAEPEAGSTRELDAAQAALDELAVDDGGAQDEGLVDDELGDESFKMDHSKSSRIACVLILLYRVSYGALKYCRNYDILKQETISNNMLKLFTGQECLNALLDYVQRCKKPTGRAARILVRLLSNALCLVNVLKHKLPLRLHNMSVTSKHPVSSCPQCKDVKRLSVKLLNQLTILAESSYGIGEISYQLIRGTPNMKETLSHTLPYIVKGEKVLKKFFIDYDALSLLVSIITESPSDFHYYVTALGKLATNIRIKDPKVLENRFSDKVCISYDPILDNLTDEEIVTFELDDLSTIKANKVFLCQNSEVFSAMLMGSFKESIEECVRLKNVTKPALEYLLTLLHCGLNNPKSDVQVFPIAEKLETNLEVLLLADRFLFEKLKGLISSAILQFLLTPETADKIYVWSLSEGMGFLCVESVAYLLTGKMCETERTRSFKSILNLEYKEQWLDDIKTIIARHLEQPM